MLQHPQFVASMLAQMTKAGREDGCGFDMMARSSERKGDLFERMSWWWWWWWWWWWYCCLLPPPPNLVGLSLGSLLLSLNLIGISFGTHLIGVSFGSLPPSKPYWMMIGKPPPLLRTFLDHHSEASPSSSNPDWIIIRKPRPPSEPYWIIIREPPAPQNLNHSEASRPLRTLLDYHLEACLPLNLIGRLSFGSLPPHPSEFYWILIWKPPPL